MKINTDGGLIMCKHKEFSFSYNNGIMVRKCKECSQVEIKIEDWVDIKELFTFLKEVVNTKEVCDFLFWLEHTIHSL